MPRERVVIENFNRGMVTGVSQKDIPIDAAAFSQDVDPNAELGVLTGRYANSNHSTTVGLNDTNGAWITRDNGTRDRVFFDGALGQLKLLVDFYGAKTQQTLKKALPVIPTFATIGRALQIGLGKSLGPLWVGIPSSSLFTTLPPEEPIVASAELEIQGKLPLLEDLVDDGTFILGHEDAGTKLYRLILSSSEIEVSSESFSNIRGICNHDTTYVWVLDQKSDGNHLLKVKKDDFDIVLDMRLAPLSYPTGDTTTNTGLGDLKKTDNSLWIAGYNIPTPGQRGGRSVWRCAIPSTSGIGHSVVQVYPFFAFAPTGTPSNGDYVNPLTGFTVEPGFQKVRHCLVPLSSTVMGMSFHAIPNLPSYFAYWSDGNYVRVSSAIIPIPEGTTAGTRLPLLFLSDESDPSYLTESGTILSSVSSGGFVTVIGAQLRRSVWATLPTIAGDVEIPSSQDSYTVSANLEVRGNTGGNALARRTVSPRSIFTISSTGTVVERFAADILSVAFTQSLTQGTFTANQKVFWKVAMGYDNFQSSCLSGVLHSEEIGGTAEKGFDIAITILDVSKLSGRLSSIDVYRGSGMTGSAAPNGFYRLITSVRMDDPRWVLTESGGITSATVSIADYDSETTGPSFEASTGQAESLDSNMVNYTLSAELNGYLFVANAKHLSLPDASHIIFRSKLGRHSMFDWTQDICRLPTIPTAMASYAGRLFVFDESSMYRVNPELMVIEDVMVGVGALGPRSVGVTEGGMLVASQKNVYLVTSNGVVAVGEAIRLGASGWLSMTHTLFQPQVIYSAELQSYAILADSNGTPIIWIYNLPKQRWDRWTCTADASGKVGLSIGKDGEMYYICSTALERVANPASPRKSFIWESQDMSFGEGIEKKKVYRVKADLSGSLTMQYGRDGGTLVTMSSENVAPADRLVESFRVRLSGVGTVYSADILFRSLVGLR